MKAILFALLAISGAVAYTHPLFQAIIASTSAQGKVGSPYDKCLDTLETINHNLIDISRKCLNGQSDQVMPEFLATIQLAVDDIKCFVAPQGRVSLPDPQCIIKHVNQFVGYLGAAVQDVQKGDFNGAFEDVTNAFAVLQDIKNC